MIELKEAALGLGFQHSAPFGLEGFHIDASDLVIRAPNGSKSGWRVQWRSPNESYCELFKLLHSTWVHVPIWSWTWGNRCWAVEVPLLEVYIPA